MDLTSGRGARPGLPVAQRTLGIGHQILEVNCESGPTPCASGYPRGRPVLHSERISLGCRILSRVVAAISPGTGGRPPGSEKSPHPDHAEYALDLSPQAMLPMKV